MAIQTFVRRSLMPVPVAELFAWHGRPGAFERLNPPWDPVEVVERQGSIRTGDRVTLKLNAGPVALRWVAEHRNYVEGKQFSDVQLKGPFSHWCHTHKVEPQGEEASVLEDRIEYALPLGPIGQTAGGGATRRMLQNMFAYRHRLTRGDLDLHRRFAHRPRRHVLLTGASGLIGGSLDPLLTTGGHRVTRLGRGGDGLTWDPRAGVLDEAHFAGVDAVVHLAGENVAGGRWTPARQERIRQSRVEGTKLLARTLAALEKPPEVLVCASATGYYGSGGDAWKDEEDPAGAGFLADVGRQWEEAAAPAIERGIRVVFARIGIVLSPSGGALGRMLPFFKAGLGGRVGTGRQYMSWIALDDVIGALYQAVMDESLSGPVNLVAPQPVTNAQFAASLGRVLGRPALLPAPAPMLRLLWGQMADALLLEGVRVRPRRLGEAGYDFRFAQLDAALAHMLGRDTS